MEADIKNGPDKATGAMAVLVAMLYERFKAGRYPIALVSMDNCSKNGAKLRESVLTMAEEWKKQGFVDDEMCIRDRDMATRPRTENNPFAYGMRLLAVFYNEMEKNKDKISFIKSYQEIEKIFYKNVLRLYKDIL